MPQHLSFMLVGTLIARTALGAGLEPVDAARYSVLAPGPWPEQADPVALPTRVQFWPSIPIVGATIHCVLAKSGYRRAPFGAPCPSLLASLAWPLPHVHLQPAGIQAGGHLHAQSVRPRGDRPGSRGGYR